MWSKWYYSKFPIIIKPIINLFGMSRGFKIIKNLNEYYESMKDGYFWIDTFRNQINIDLIIINGKIMFYKCLHSIPNKLIDGIFDYHEKIISIIYLKILFHGYKNLKIIQVHNLK